jgi:hypothetical protein
VTRRKFASYLGLCFVLALAAQAQHDGSGSKAQIEHGTARMVFQVASNILQ